MSRGTRTVAVVVAVASMVLLGGCVATAQLPDGRLTRAELLSVRAAQLDVQWAQANLPDELRPNEDSFTVVSTAEWAGSVVACMTTAGYENYGVVEGTIQIGKSSTLSEPQAEKIDFYECRAAFQLSEELQLTRAQRDYLYDYYRSTLVPCLERQGVHVESPPTREQFAATGVGMGWNPYYAMDALSFGEVVADDALLSACPSFPKDQRFDSWRIAAAD